MGRVVAQKFKKEIKKDIDRAIRYFNILSAINDLRLSERQVQLLAFTAVRGTITPKAAREEFVRMFNSSLNSVENLKGTLKNMGLLVKRGGMYKVPSYLDLDFSEKLVLRVELKTEEKNG